MTNDYPPVHITSVDQAASLRDRAAEVVPGIAAVVEFVCEHEDELDGRGIQSVMLSFDVAVFAEQVVKARDELRTLTGCTGGHEK